MSVIAVDGIAYQTDLPYRYVFEPHELAAIRSCNLEHGFCVVKQVITPELVDALKQSVRETLIGDNPLKPGETRVHLHFVEFSPPLTSLLENEPYMAIARVLYGEDLTVHRTAAIVKNVGCGYGGWHSDWSFPEGRITHASEWLNTREGCYSLWFYLNGTHPSRAGLALMPDSHRMDWQAPEGFQFTPGRRSFHKVGSDTNGYAGMDVPGLLPLLTEPGDLIVFAERTYHGVFPHNGDEVRLSCGIGFRPGRTPYPVPWPVPESAVAFKTGVPERLQPLVEQYVGIEPNWPIDGGRPSP